MRSNVLNSSLESRPKISPQSPQHQHQHLVQKLLRSMLASMGLSFSLVLGYYALRIAFDLNGFIQVLLALALSSTMMLLGFMISSVLYFRRYQAKEMGRVVELMLLGRVVHFLVLVGTFIFLINFAAPEAFKLALWFSLIAFFVHNVFSWSFFRRMK